MRKVKSCFTAGHFINFNQSELNRNFSNEISFCAQLTVPYFSRNLPI